MRTCLSQQGGRFTAAPISYDKESLSFRRGVKEELVFAPCTQQEFFKVCRVHGATEGTSRQQRFLWVSYGVRIEHGNTHSLPYVPGHT
jgi:hypothetical protein